MAVYSHFNYTNKEVKDGTQCTVTSIMSCGKVVRGKAVRKDEDAAEDAATSILREEIKSHLNKCKRACNRAT